MKALLLTICVCVAVAFAAPGQGTFQNLDFESPTIVPIPGDPYGRIEAGPALPGWRAYVGTAQLSGVLYNDFFLSSAGVSLFGPDNPVPNALQGHYFVVLQNSVPAAAPPALAQTGTIPNDARSIRFYTIRAVPTLAVSFANQAIPLSVLETTAGAFTCYAWGADISAFAGQNGELRFWGEGYLDYIHFSTQPIPEPGAAALAVLGALVAVWRRKYQR